MVVVVNGYGENFVIWVSKRITLDLPTSGFKSGWVSLRKDVSRRQVGTV